ncbi:MAG: ATPase [Nitrosomonadales bacterium SCN 54-20]|nr:MAG: ATPase [Nitrosomonadales bacterium SCN 54-20]
MANPIGEMLVREGLISSAQLAQALARQRQDNGRLGDILASLGFLTTNQFRQFFQPVPQVPLKASDTGLSEAFLTDLLLKAAYLEAGTFSLQQISDTLALPFSVVDELAELMKADQLVAIRSATGYSRASHVLELTKRGRERAEAALDTSRYVGAAPVPLRDYSRAMARQCVRQVEVDDEWIRDSLKHMVIGERMLNQLGPAFASGRSIFFYGPPGTGKTSITEILGRALPGHIYMPQAIEVSGQVIRLFDPSIHFSVEDESSEDAELDLSRSVKHDLRWKKCRRPVVMVGGELSLDMLDLRYDASSKFYEAPIQMKAGNGVFILDDFGRQQVEPRQLLNRWIIPLERGTDFPTLHTGLKFEIPFDQITVFCTNLRPGDLVDEAFLRRIRHKIQVQYQTEDEFREILRRVCKGQGIAYDAEAAEYLLDNYYRKAGRPLTGSHPRDLVEHIVDRARFMRRLPELTPETVDLAAASYFVEM